MRTLIFKVNQLGDNLVFLPAVQAIIEKCGAGATHVFTTGTAAGFYEGLLPESNLHIYDRAPFNSAWKNPAFLFSLVRTIRSIKPDLVLVPFDQGNVARILARLSGAKWRVGVENSATKTNGCLNYRIATDLASPMAEQDWEVIRKLDDIDSCEIESISEKPPAPDLSHLIKASNRVSARRILIHPGASRAYKQWPLTRFVGLAEKLVERGFEVVWYTQDAPEESRLPGAVIRRSLGSLNEFINDLASARLFIGNNSGPMNLANALQLPSIIFSGPSPPKWDPYWHRDRVVNLRVPELACQPCDKVSGPINHCTNEESPMACMQEISVDHVCGKVDQLWEQFYSR